MRFGGGKQEQYINSAIRQTKGKECPMPLVAMNDARQQFQIKLDFYLDDFGYLVDGVLEEKLVPKDFRMPASRLQQIRTYGQPTAVEMDQFCQVFELEGEERDSFYALVDDLDNSHPVGVEDEQSSPTPSPDHGAAAQATVPVQSDDDTPSEEREPVAISEEATLEVAVAVEVDELSSGLIVDEEAASVELEESVPAVETFDSFLARELNGDTQRKRRVARRIKRSVEYLSLVASGAARVNDDMAQKLAYALRMPPAKTCRYWQLYTAA